MKRAIAAAICALPFVSFAQTVKVGAKPSAVFSPTPGGYILRQPGPALNLSLTPQPVTPPSGGIKGTGAFTGGKKFRLNGNDFEMGGKYEMPIPKTAQKAEVTAISKIPQKSMAKALLKTLPLIGNAYALGEVLSEMAALWDAQDPSGQTITNPATGEIYREVPNRHFTGAGFEGSSAQAVCSQYMVTYSTNGVTATSAPAVAEGSGDNWSCVHPFYANYPLFPLNVSYTRTTKAPPPEEVYDQQAESMDTQETGSMLDAAQSTGATESMGLDLPADMPTEVTGPSSVPQSTKTTQNSDGTSTTTISNTTINYAGNNISISTTSNTTNRAADGSVISSSDTTESGVPDDPNPQEQTPQDTPGLCELYPDILACKKLDSVPSEEIPKRSENIALQDGLNFGGGSCIPNLVVNVFGRQVTVVEMAVPCDWISTYLKPFILLLASLSAVFIIYPRND